MNIERLKSILIVENIPKSYYSINDKYTCDMLVLQSFGYESKNYWEYFIFDERGGKNEYRSFDNEDIACRYFLYMVLYFLDRADLIKKYILGYVSITKISNAKINEGNKAFPCILKLKRLFNKFDRKELTILKFDKYNRNQMFYMIKDVGNEIILSIVHNTTRNQVLNKMRYITNPNFKDIECNSYLHLACSSYDIEAISILLDIGANPNLKNKRGELPILLLHDLSNPVNATILDLMLKHRLDLNVKLNSLYRNRTLKEMLDFMWKDYEWYDEIIKKHI